MSWLCFVDLIITYVCHLQEISKLHSYISATTCTRIHDSFSVPASTITGVPEALSGADDETVPVTSQPCQWKQPRKIIEIEHYATSRSPWPLRNMSTGRRKEKIEAIGGF